MEYGNQAQTLGRSSTIGAYAEAARPTPQPVTGAVESLDKSVALLHERLHELEQRLSGVLSPLPPQGVSEPQGKLARHSLALQIESAASNVGGAISRVEGLLSRLEL